MRVVCRHGHYAFYPRKTSDIRQFANAFDIELEREEDYFTFKALKGAKEYSLATLPYLELPAIETFQGKPWDVMEANGFVYSIDLDKLVPKTSIVGVVEITQKNFFYVCNVPLLQAGARSMTGERIVSFSGEFMEDLFYLRLLEFDYE
jgi:hypothetical protein